MRARVVVGVNAGVMLALGLALLILWLYILVAGAPPSAIRAGVVATFVLAAGLFGRQVSPIHCAN